MAMADGISAIAAMTAALAGVVLGGLFYGGLWWTVRRLASFRRPALALMASALLRTAVALTGFWWVADGRWWRIALCLAGFVLARLVVTWTTKRPSAARQARHAA